MDRPESHLEESLDAHVRSIDGVERVTVLKTYRVIVEVSREFVGDEAYNAEWVIMEENPKLSLSFVTRVKGDDDD